MSSQLKPRGRGAFPSFLCAHIREARRGGAAGYEQVGLEIMKAVAGLRPYELEAEEWEAQLDVLEELVDGGDHAGVLRWFEEQVPRVMQLIPPRRRETLLAGMLRAVRETEGECFLM